MSTIEKTNFQFPKQTTFYKGKVRDVYHLGKEIIVMVATDRISAFDVVLPKGIPYKGQVLNQLASLFLDQTSDIVPNWKLATPDPNVTVGLSCEPIKVEMVIRGYLSGHAWREYSAGKRILCGVSLPEGLKKNDRLPNPIITPATKADEGHDEDISREEIIAKKIVSEEIYKKLEAFTFALFKRGTDLAAKKGLILVDTKYEFGMRGKEIYLIDEIHTPDSSRYFYADTYDNLQALGKDQRQLSKEFVREWLIQNDFQGKEGQSVPEMSDEWVELISERYIELFEKISGLTFKKENSEAILKRIEKNVLAYLETIQSKLEFV